MHACLLGLTELQSYLKQVISSCCDSQNNFLVKLNGKWLVSICSAADVCTWLFSAQLCQIAMQQYRTVLERTLPLQVRNLGSCVKVAVDFVLPESLTQAFKFAEEFRIMAKEEAFEKDADGNSVPVHPKDRQHTDKLQAELSMCLAAKSAVKLLQEADRQPKNTGACSWSCLQDVSNTVSAYSHACLLLAHFAFKCASHEQAAGS